MSAMGLFSAYNQANKPEKEPDEDYVLEESPGSDDPAWGHRVDRFIELGWGPLLAMGMASARCDWHEAKRLLDAGATHEQVSGILL